MNPIRRLRRRLADIERNSATRPGGRWRRATEYALLVSLPIAILLALLFDDLGVTVERDRSVRFRVGRDGVDGSVLVVRTEPEHDRRPWAMTLPIGTVSVETRIIRRGWPVPSVIERPPPRLLANLILAPEQTVPLGDVDRVASVEKRTGVSLDGVDDAVVTTLSGATSLADLADGVRSGRSTIRRSWGASIASGAATWLLLFLTSVLGIRATQLITWILARMRRRRVVRRLRAGRCPDCLYDLHMERFPKRCPECGRAIWS